MGGLLQTATEQGSVRNVCILCSQGFKFPLPEGEGQGEGV